MAEIFLKSRDIIIISNQSYADRYWTSKQYITRELIKNNRVLYVDGNYSFGKMLLGLMGKNWPVTLSGQLRQKEENLYIYTPPPRLPLRNHFAFFSRLHQKLLLNSIRKISNKLKLQNSIVWSFLHSSNHLVGKLNEKMFIYHCVDDWPRLLPLASMGWSQQIIKDELDLAQKSTLCFCTAAILKEKLDAVNNNVFYIPNAVETGLFSKARDKETRFPLDIALLNSPVIGFIGSLEKWVDADLLFDIFQEKKNWTFLSVGVAGKTEKTKKLNSLSNVHLLGLKPKEALPGYLKKIDVALIPFQIDELGKSISPLKLFEYFAAGKPVVAADLPEIARFSKYLWLAKSKNDYIVGIEEALKKKDDPDYIKELGALARKHSWPERIREYNQAIEKTVEGKKE